MPDLITLADAKATLSIGSGTADDAQIAVYITAATPVIEDITGPVLAASGRTKVFDGGTVAVLLPCAVTAVTTVVENAVTLTDYTVNLAAGVVYAGTSLASRQFFPGRQNITVTYTAGTATGTSDVPAHIRLATKELVRFWWQIGQQANRPGFGDQAEPDAWTPSGFAVPRRVIELCAPTPRMAGFA